MLPKMHISAKHAYCLDQGAKTAIPQIQQIQDEFAQKSHLLFQLHQSIKFGSIMSIVKLNN